MKTIFAFLSSKKKYIKSNVRQKTKGEKESKKCNGTRKKGKKNFLFIEYFKNK